MADARLTVVVGPTAVGKGTVVAELRRRHPEVWISVSATTRPPRPGEIDGVHYYFVTDAQFDALVSDDAMLEWAEVHKKYRYGTQRAPVVEHLAEGVPVLLEIDLQGARQVRQTMPDALFVFIAPPSPEELVHRLTGRGTESPEEQRRRLATAEAEMAAAGEFDAIIVNNTVDVAATQLAELMGLPEHSY